VFVLASLLAALIAAMPVAAVGQPAPIGWPEAVARLAAERTRAMSCAARARTLDAATAERFGATYTEAKAEIDGVIAGLAVVLTQGGGQPAALPDLEQRMAAGFAGRKHFCEAVLARLPAQEGERSLVTELVSGVAKPLIEAVVDLYKYGSEANRLRRDTIRAQVEATQWPAFADIAPSR
jgi:hypothetical protein